MYSASLFLPFPICTGRKIKNQLENRIYKRSLLSEKQCGRSESRSAESEKRKNEAGKRIKNQPSARRIKGGSLRN